MSPRVLGALAAASLGWGFAAIGVRTAFEAGVTTFTIIGVRLGVAALAVVVFSLVRSRRLTRELWLHGAFIGIPRIGLAPVLFIASLRYISAGVEAIIITTIPVVTALMAWLFLKEEQSRAQQAGFAVALAGSLVIIVSGESGLAAGEGNPLLGGLLALGGVFFASLSGVVARYYAPRHDTASLAVPMFITGGAFAFAAAFVLRDFHPGELDLPLWVLLVALGLGSTLLPFAATLYAAKHTTAARTALVAYVAPLITVIGGVLILDEVLTAPILIGGSLALTGVVLAGSSTRFPRRVGA
ncbi:MAG: DMT family transporter [Acidimicrobiia bacterium]|nr:DMT family transporter [Acidimicrobiia bacterium]